MPITISIDTKLITDHLAKLEKKLDDPKELLGSIGGEMEKRIRNRFETQTDPNGRQWSPWAESTKASYPPGGRGRLLDRNGDMHDSISWSADDTSVFCKSLALRPPINPATFH